MDGGGVAAAADAIGLGSQSMQLRTEFQARQDALRCASKTYELHWLYQSAYFPRAGPFEITIKLLLIGNRT